VGHDLLRTCAYLVLTSLPSPRQHPLARDICSAIRDVRSEDPRGKMKLSIFVLVERREDDLFPTGSLGVLMSAASSSLRFL
jgi:putative IMPACT (imprinted ancient) family translation regulator